MVCAAGSAAQEVIKVESTGGATVITSSGPMPNAEIRKAVEAAAAARAGESSRKDDDKGKPNGQPKPDGDKEKDK